MLLALLAVVIGVAAGLAAGGHFANLERVDVRLVVLPIAWIVLNTWARRGIGPVRYAALLASMACLLLFVVVNARRLPGMWLVALGVGLNLFMVADNHGMPYSPTALQAAGVLPPTFDAVPTANVARHPQRAGDQLVMLGGVIPVRPLRMVVSFGDLFVAFGLAVVTMNVADPSLGSATADPVAVDPSLGSATSDPVAVDPIAVASQLTRTHAGSDRTAAIARDELRRILSLIDDERALLDITADGGELIDPSELAARYAVRQALRRHSLPDVIDVRTADELSRRELAGLRTPRSRP